MKSLIIMLGCWMSGYVSAGGIVQGSALVVRNVYLYRRDPVRNPEPETQYIYVPPTKSILKAQVKSSQVIGFKGTTFVKNDHGKQVMNGDDAVVLGGYSRKKVSVGGTQNGSGKLRAHAEGPNVRVKLHVPEGSKGSIYTKTTAGKVSQTIDHTQSPFRWDIPKNAGGKIVIGGAEIDGPGSVKAKTWNE